MNKYLFLLASFISLQASAFEIDSVLRTQMIREGQAELCNLLEYNAHAAPEDKRFLVVIDGDPNGVNYTREKNVNPNSNEDILDQQTVDAINDTLAAAYANYGVEMFVIVMKSFDLLFQTELPAYPTARDIFTTRLYDEASNINMLRATHQQLTYEIAFGSMARTRDYLVYSRATYKGAYAPGKVGVWDLIRTIPIYGTTTTYPKLDELKDCFHARTTNDPNVMQSGLQYSLKAASARFYETAKYMAIKGAIMTTYTSTGMSAIFQQFRPGVDYESLAEPERRRALSVFAGYSMGHNGLESEELYACRIIESTPSTQVSAFLDHLSQVSELNTNQYYLGDKPDKALIVVLIGRMDDVGSGGDNYTRMMRGITSIAMSDLTFASAHMPTTDQHWIDRRIYWDDWHVLTNAPIGTHDYDVTLNNNGSITYTKKVMDRLESHIQGQTGEYYYTEHWDNTYSPVQINPFDFVVFTNRSSLGMLQVAGAAPDQPFIAPAIFLKYADDKAFNTNAITVTAIVLDVVAITTGPFAILGAMTAANYALAAFEALQFLGSTLNLVANQLASEEFKEAVGIFNVVVAGWGLAKITVTGAKYTANYINAVKSGDVQPISVLLAQQYCAKYDAITDWSHVDAATKEEMRRMREMLGKQVVNGTAAITHVTVLEQRAAFWQGWIDNCCPNKAWTNTTFVTEGLDYSSFKIANSAIDNEMRSLYQTSALADQFLPSVINSGTTNPVRKAVSEGEIFYKIVPKGNSITAPSPYYLSASEFQLIKSNPATIEQKLGLPLTSVNNEYDVFTITSRTDENVVFESTIAPTKQFANSTPEMIYQTPGGATQTLILNNNASNLWLKSSAPVETISPNVLPQIQN